MAIGRADLGRLLALDAAAWTTLSIAVGLAANLVPRRWFDHDTALTRLRPVERRGAAYERVRVRRWKDHLPEAGTVFGGASKRRLPRRADLARFVEETRRAEWVHWSLMATGPLFALWNPWPLALAMIGFGVVANLPCLVVQRYNRARLGRVLDRRPAPQTARRSQPTAVGPT